MQQAAVPDPPRFAEPAGRWIVATTVLGSAVVFLTSTVVNVALPDIGRDLGADVTGLQWVVNAYLITLAALILLGGSLGDRYGRRRVYVTGLVSFAASSVLCAVAWNLPTLVVFRALQGAAGALLMPGSLAIIQASIHPEDRAEAIGAWSALSGVGAAVGPVVGGWLVDIAGWPSIFWMTAPIAAMVAVVAVRHVPESRDPAAVGPPDIPGAALITVGLVGISVALLQAGGPGSTTQVVVAAVVGAVALAAVVPVERRMPDPLVPPAVAGNGQLVAANVVTLVVYAALGGVFFFLVIHLQTVLGYSAFEAGAATLPITGLLLVMSPRAGALAQRIGPRRPLTVGPLVLAAGMLLLAAVGPGDAYASAVLPAVAVFGVGLGLTVAPVTATALAAVEEAHAGLASGLNNAVARTAQLLAVAVLPLVAGLSGDAYRHPAVFERGFGIAMQVAAGTAIVGAVVAWTTIEDDVLDDAVQERLDAIP